MHERIESFVSSAAVLQLAYGVYIVREVMAYLMKVSWHDWSTFAVADD